MSTRKQFFNNSSNSKEIPECSIALLGALGSGKSGMYFVHCCHYLNICVLCVVTLLHVMKRYKLDTVQMFIYVVLRKQSLTFVQTEITME